MKPSIFMEPADVLRSGARPWPSRRVTTILRFPSYLDGEKLAKATIYDYLVTVGAVHKSPGTSRLGASNAPAMSGADDFWAECGRDGPRKICERFRFSGLRFVCLVLRRAGDPFVRLSLALLSLMYWVTVTECFHDPIGGYSA